LLGRVFDFSVECVLLESARANLTWLWFEDPDEILGARLRNHSFELAEECEDPEACAPRSRDVAVLPRGQGAIVLLNETNVFRNDMLAQHDHARFLERVISVNGPAREVLVLRPSQAFSLAALVGRRGWMVLASLSVVVALIVARAAPRFGPGIPDPPEARRSRMEHVEASGAFLWRNGFGGALREACQGAVLDRLLARRPGLRRSGEEEQRKALIGLAKLRDEEANAVFAGTETARADVFLRQVKTLETIRRSL
jgi:hypothetical protein